MPPLPENNYHVAPTDELTAALWNAVLASVAGRLAAREALEASFEGLIAGGTQAALDLIQENVAPQIEVAQQTLTDLQAQLDAFIGEGNAPNALKLGDQLPAYYLALANATGMLAYNKVTGIDAAIGTAVAALVNSSPAALDTLKELSDAIGGDASFATTMTAALADRRRLPKLARTITAASSAGDRTLGVGDIGKLVIFSGTSDFTVTFSPAATLLTGWSVLFRSEGKCIVTLDPNGSETIDGQTTARALYHQSGELVCDGSNFYSIGRQNRLLLDSQTFSGVALVDFTSIAPGYRRYTFEAKSLITAAGAVNVNARFSVDNGANYRATSGDYFQHHAYADGANYTNAFYNTATAIQFLIGNAQASFANNFTLKLVNLQDALVRHQYDYVSQGSFSNGGVFSTANGRGELSAPSTSPINAMRFLTSTSTMSGEIALYGEA